MSTKIPILREDDGILLGFVTNEHSSWTAQTIFGYTLARVESQFAAEDIIRSEALLAQKGLWRYLDSDGEWYPCTLKEVYENRVVVVRTNELGFIVPDDYKQVILKNPSESNLQKA